jgi:signal transduction histidine kinase
MNRTWLVFAVGLACMLAVMFFYGLAAMDRTRDIYQQVNRVQQRQEQVQKSLNSITVRIYQISVAVREYLLDDSDLHAAIYREDAAIDRREITLELAELRKLLPAQSVAPAQRLEEELDRYWKFVEPVFHWTPAQRTERGTYFLRQQQRPRRDNLLAITEELRRLNENNFQAQYAEMARAQASFQTQYRNSLLLCLALGALVAAACVFRILQLERRARKHQEATESAERELRILSTQLMSAQEEERKALSRELHDEVGQMLTALRMELGGLERTRYATQGRFEQHVSEAKALAERTMRLVRNLAVELRPSMLDQLGLAPALQWQAQEFTERSGIKVQLTIPEDFDDASDRIRTCIYRITQEALTNCAKHAAASEVTIQLASNRREIAFEIRDNGQGVDPELLATRGRGFGLIGIEERVRELGGRFQFHSRPGGGTTIKVTIPLDPKDSNHHDDYSIARG